MPLTSAANGTQTAVLSTEHTLATITVAGVYVLAVDMSNMANGDITTLRMKTKCKAASTSRLAYEATFAHVQGDPNKYSIPVPSDTEIVCTLEQTAGTGRNYDWNLLSL